MCMGVRDVEVDGRGRNTMQSEQRPRCSRRIKGEQRDGWISITYNNEREEETHHHEYDEPQILGEPRDDDHISFLFVSSIKYVLLHCALGSFFLRSRP